MVGLNVLGVFLFDYCTVFFIVVVAVVVIVVVVCYIFNLSKITVMWKKIMIINV